MILFLDKMVQYSTTIALISFVLSYIYNFSVNVSANESKVNIFSVSQYLDLF